MEEIQDFERLLYRPDREHVRDLRTVRRGRGGGGASGEPDLDVNVRVFTRPNTPNSSRTPKLPRPPTG
jgi:hypothetical protein